jgi:hypothetical protein
MRASHQEGRIAIVTNVERGMRRAGAPQVSACLTVKPYFITHQHYRK